MAAEGTDPALVPGSSHPPVYVDLDWSGGVAAAYYQLGLAEQTAWWVAGLPTTQRMVNDATPEETDVLRSSCVPVGQARRPSPSGFPRRPREPARCFWRARRGWPASATP